MTPSVRTLKGARINGYKGSIKLCPRGANNCGFSNAHIKLQPDDLLYIEMVRQGAAKIDPQYSSGMNELVVNSKELSRHMTPAINDNSYFRTRTYIDTRTVNEDILNEIRDVMQAQNVTIANAIEYLNQVKNYGIKYDVEILTLEGCEKKHRK